MHRPPPQRPPDRPPPERQPRGSIGPGGPRTTVSPSSSGRHSVRETGSAREVRDSVRDSARDSTRDAREAAANLYSFGTNPTSQPRLSELSESRWSAANATDQAVETKLKERELEAERLWWSEAAERQVKELESSFMQEQSKNTGKLSKDLHATQERLELLIEGERKQRHATLADVWEELEAQKVMIADVVRQMEKDLRNQMQDKAEDSDEHSGRSGGRSAALRSKASIVDSQRVQWEKQKDHQLSGLETSIATLRQQLEQNAAAVRQDLDAHTTSLRQEVEHHAGSVRQELDRRAAMAIPPSTSSLAGPEATAELNAVVTGLRAELEGLKDRSELQAQSQQELHALHQVLSQSMGELSKGLEEVSSTTAATERRLKQRVEELHGEVDAAGRQRLDQVLEAVEVSSQRLAQSLADERERRTSEAHVLRARLDALGGQVEDFVTSSEKTMTSLQRCEVPVADEGDGGKAAEAARKAAEAAERLRGDLRKAEEALAAALEAGLAEARKEREELGAVMRENAMAQEDKLGRIFADGLAEERSWCAEQLAGLWRHADEVAQGGGAVARTIHTGPLQQEDGAEELERMDVARVMAELTLLREAVQAMQSDRFAIASSEASSVPFLKSAGLALGTRVDLLQEQLRNQASASAARLETLEGKLAAAAKASDLRILEEEIRRLDSKELAQLSRRLEGAEAEVRRALREIRPLSARCEAAESELQRLARDNGPMISGLASIQVELQALKAVQLAAKPPAAAAGLRTPQAASRAKSPSRRPSVPSVEELPPDSNRARSPARRVVEEPAPALSNELKASLGSLLQRVHETLATTGGPRKADVQELVSAGQPIVEGRLMRVQPPGSLENSMQAPAPGADATGDNAEGLMQALRAVQELRERNLALREENAGLVEEILQQQQEGLSPVSVKGMQWTPSAQQSVCATPADVSATAQLVEPPAVVVASPTAVGPPINRVTSPDPNHTARRPTSSVALSAAPPLSAKQLKAPAAANPVLAGRGTRSPAPPGPTARTLAATQGNLKEVPVESRRPEAHQSPRLQPRSSLPVQAGGYAALLGQEQPQGPVLRPGGMSEALAARLMAREAGKFP